MKKINVLLLLLIGVVLLTSCGETAQESARIESGSNNPGYRGNPHPQVERKYKIDPEQQKLFESQIQEGNRKQGEEKEGAKPNI